MRLKTLFIAFLFFVSLSAICNVAITVTELKTPSVSNWNDSVRHGYLILGGNGTEPDGDGRGGHPK